MRRIQLIGLCGLLINALLVACGGASGSSAVDAGDTPLSVVLPLNNPNCRVALAESAWLGEAWAAVRAAGLTPVRVSCKTDPDRQPLSFCVSPQVVYSVLEIPQGQLPEAQRLGYQPLGADRGLQDLSCP